MFIFFLLIIEDNFNSRIVIKSENFMKIWIINLEQFCTFEYLTFKQLFYLSENQHVFLFHPLFSVSIFYRWKEKELVYYIISNVNKVRQT